MNKMYTVLLALAAFAMLVPAHAAEACYTTSAPELTIPDETGDLGGDIYVDNDLCQVDLSCTFSLWIYQETNGLGGLQRGDEVVNDIAECTDGTVADTNIF